MTNFNSSSRKCCVCGQEHNERKRVYFRKQYDQILCNKHYQQMLRCGKVLDNNCRGVFDSNEYSIVGNCIVVDCYDSHGNIAGQFIADKEDLPLVKSNKWRLTPKRNLLYVVTGNKTSCPITYFHRAVLNYSGPLEIDHIDGNPLNNRKSNLRIVTRQEQMMNLSPKKNCFTGIRWVSYDKRNGKYSVDCTLNKQRYYFKTFNSLEEAVYARYVVEKRLNKNRSKKNDNNIHRLISGLSIQNRREIEDYLSTKMSW